MTIGKRIRFYRKENKLTLKELSSLTGLSVSFISDIENGRRNPSVENLQKLADALNVSTDTLLGNGKSRFSSKNQSTKDDKSTIYTIAAHFEGEEFTPEEQEEINNFIQYVLSKRQK